MIRITLKAGHHRPIQLRCSYTQSVDEAEGSDKSLDLLSLVDIMRGSRNFCQWAGGPGPTPDSQKTAWATF